MSNLAEATRAAGAGPQLIRSDKSMKTIMHFTNYYIWITSIFEGPNNYLQKLFDPIIKAFGFFPSQFQDKVKNMTLYLEYLDTMKTLMNFLSFMFNKIPKSNQKI
jgi:hypothetical protein